MKSAASRAIVLTFGIAFSSLPEFAADGKAALEVMLAAAK